LRRDLEELLFMEIDFLIILEFDLIKKYVTKNLKSFKGNDSLPFMEKRVSK